jgi:hypothetical protein
MRQPYIGQTRNRVSEAGIRRRTMPRSAERGAVRRRSSFSMIGGSRGLRQTRAAAGVRAPVATCRVAARNRGAEAAPGRTTPQCPDPGRTRRPRPAIFHMPISPNLALSPISRRDVGLGLLSPAGVGCSAPHRAGSRPWYCYIPAAPRCSATDVRTCGSGGVSRCWATHLRACRILALTRRQAGRSLAA